MAQTGAIFNSLIYGGINSANYGIYITGEGVFNAPERAVELVSVPGRNGAVAIDQGYWNNIEITYPAGTFADNETDFAQAVSDFKNAIMSLKGYQKLTDSYNPSEYRMAMYISGLEVEAANSNIAGEFDLVFNCKPQRYLNSGETAITGISTNDIIMNPTQYDSGPLLAVTGYGTIGFNGYSITLSNDVMGDITLLPAGNAKFNSAISFNTALYNSGDDITFPSTYYQFRISRKTTAYTLQSCSLSDSGSGKTALIASTDDYYQLQTTFDKTTFDSSADTTITNVCTAVISVSGTTATVTVTTTFAYTAADNKITPSCMIHYDSAASTRLKFSYDNNKVFYFDDFMVDSTVSVLGTPTYIDCDLGEAYRISNGDAIGLNAYIDMGSDLPKLSAGANTITFSNSVTDLKIIPRWWRL